MEINAGDKSPAYQSRPDTKHEKQKQVLRLRYASLRMTTLLRVVLSHPFAKNANGWGTQNFGSIKNSAYVYE